MKCLFLPPYLSFFAKHAILNFFVRLYVSLPASTTGAHAKKQGEDLSENDGDEDEGIFHGEQRRCMISFENKISLFYNPLWISCIANALIKHPCLIIICRATFSQRLHVSECDGSCSQGSIFRSGEFLTLEIDNIQYLSK